MQWILPSFFECHSTTNSRAIKTRRGRTARATRQHIVKRVNRLYKRSFALKGIEPRVSFLAVKQYQVKDDGWFSGNFRQIPAIM